MTERDKTYGMSKEDFLKAIGHFNPNANLSKVALAYDYAKRHHAGQKRASGDDHFTHVQEVAFLLAELRLDSDTVAAGLLHDLIEDTKVTADDIARHFGRDIRELVEGVTKIKPLDLRKQEKTNLQSLRKMIMATGKDVRVIIIKLIDRLHNMRTLKFLDEQKRVQIANETLNIYAPIAYKLGMYQVKSELEDLSLRYIEPKVYDEIKQRVAKTRVERDEEVSHIMEQIRRVLKETGVKAEVTGRAKSFYSIYKKMKKKGLAFEDIYDLYAIRVIVDSVEDCYRAVGIIHSKFTPIPKMFDDYIATPKPNLYRSLHTEIIFNGRPVEIQFRTWEMHFEAEDGIAAHWRYHGTERDKQFDKRITWLKQLLEWKRTSEDAEDFIESLKVDLFKDQIVVFTPKGDPIFLAEGASPLDFAYMVHTEIGNHCMRAKVNGEIRPLDSELKSGDLCEILVSRSQTVSRNWLKFVKTNQAREKIRSALGIVKEFEKPDKRKHIENEEQMQGLISSRGLKKTHFKVPRCCRLVYGDEIVGFRMKDGKIAVHAATCETLNTLEDARKLRLEWQKDEKRRLVHMRVEILDRIGLLADILNILAKNKMNVETVNQKLVRGRLVITFELMPKGEDIDVAEIKDKIGKVRNVLSVS